MPNEDGMGLAVDIACTTSKARYEMVDVAIKFFRRIGIVGEHSGNFIHLDVDPIKRRELSGLIEDRKNPSHVLPKSNWLESMKLRVWARRISTYCTIRRRPYHGPYLLRPEIFKNIPIDVDPSKTQDVIWTY